MSFEYPMSLESPSSPAKIEKEKDENEILEVKQVDQE